MSYIDRARHAFAEFLAGDLIQDKVDHAYMAAIEDAFAKSEAAAATQDLSWHDREQNLADILEAWRLNPYARRIVNLHTSFVVGKKLTIGSANPKIDEWVKAWWSHKKNRINLEIYELSNELCRAGELFFTLHTNKHDGMQYIRGIPARRIVNIETAANDYRKELVYHELLDNQFNTRPWKSWEHPDVINDPTQPCMVHYAINRPIGAVRSHGGDLDPMLPWLRRYNAWLKDRLRINKNRNAWVWKMTAADKNRVKELERKYAGGLTAGSVWIGMPEEDLDSVVTHVNAGDADEDGRALRQSIAVAGNVAPHMLADTRGATRASAKEANAPTFQFWSMRQLQFVTFLKDLAEISATRTHRTGKFLRWLPDNWHWTHEVSDLTREDNIALARSANTIVNALATMHERGWVDRETAIGLATKFAGEAIDPKDIIERVDNPPDEEQITRDEQELNEAQEQIAPMLDIPWPPEPVNNGSNAPE